MSKKSDVKKLSNKVLISHNYISLSKHCKESIYIIQTYSNITYFLVGVALV